MYYASTAIIWLSNLCINASTCLFCWGLLQISTSLPPLDLLHELKIAEEKLGRVYTRRWGPRQIDLDILLYDNLVLQTETLTIPHASMHEREFVLRPLCEYV